MSSNEEGLRPCVSLKTLVSKHGVPEIRMMLFEREDSAILQELKLYSRRRRRGRVPTTERSFSTIDVAIPNRV
jgi:hypothetical protein